MCLDMTFKDIAEAYRHVINAAKRPVMIDERQVQAVEARIELDLKIGSAFTRKQTLGLKALGGPLDGPTISYGILQGPQSNG